AKVAALESRQRYARQSCFLLPAALSFVPSKEKSAIVFNWPTNNTAELVAAEAGFLRRKEVSRVEHRVTMKFKGRAVEVVGPCLGSDDDLAAGLTSIISRISAGQHFELTHRIQNWSMQGLVGRLVVVIDAVLDVVVGNFAVTGNVEAAAEAE